jgi:hypothetical protein
VILSDGDNFDRTGFQKTLGRHICSFSVPSARYTDKAEGQAGLAGNHTAKPASSQIGESGRVEVPQKYRQRPN